MVDEAMVRPQVALVMAAVRVVVMVEAAAGGEGMETATRGPRCHTSSTVW